LLAAARRPLIVTDVGSTKLSIVHAYRDNRNQYLTFVGGHPIAGTAQAGLRYARADMFRGRPWLFTPDPDGAGDATAHLAAVQHLQRFVRAIGAEPGLLDSADEHDRIMAYVSHLPQLAASALMRVAGENVGPPGFAHSGAGLFDTTRLASSPATMWTDILKSNAGHVRRALDAFITDLQAIRDQLTAPGAADWLETGARWRARLVNNHTEEVTR
jgi:prephenate dehydrogenase